MKKYYITDQGTPVEFEYSSEYQLQKFEAGQPQLAGKSVSKKTYSERRAQAESLAERSRRAGNLSSQLEQIWRTFAHLHGEGVELPPETVTMMNAILGESDDQE